MDQFPAKRVGIEGKILHPLHQGRFDRIGQSQGVDVGGKIQNGPLYPLPCGVNIPAVYQFYHVKVIPFTA